MKYPEDYINQIIQGDALTILKQLPDEIVNCCVSSPPYWNLRDYGVKGQLGLEKTFEEYIAKLCDIFDQVKRVLRKDGTCWVNLGDTYNSTPIGRQVDPKRKIKNGDFSYNHKKNVVKNLSTKTLLLIPQRFEIEMVNRGWILRNTIIWKKPNCMPSSANDRFTVDFEYLFFFVKSKNYWFEQQFEEYTEPLNRWGGPSIRNSSHKYIEIGEPKLGKFGATSMFRKGRPVRPDENGRNKRSVWTIPTQPFPEAHFATFPERLIETPIKAGCPEFVCKKCGKARVKIFKEATGGTKGHSWHDHSADMKKGNVKKQTGSEYNTYKRGNFKGYTDCGCNASFESGIVLDPFSGAGTTAVVAKKQGKKYIGIELKQEYIDMANKRLRKIAERLF